MELDLKVDVPVRVSTEYNTITGAVTLTATIELSSYVVRFIGQNNLAAMESNLRLRLEESLEDYSEGVTHHETKET